MALLVFDLDHFKVINDRYGHAAGDTVLVAVAAAAAQCVRAGDVLARVGGEEFAILLKDASDGDARRLAERLRVAVSNTQVPCDGAVMSVTISVGIGLFDGALPRTSQELFQHADDRLYDEKRLVRNRVEG